MNQRAGTSFESLQSRPRRGLFGVLAGVLLAGTIAVTPMTSGAATLDVYDLALAKTSAVLGTGEDTIIDYDITVRNQGTVDSGDFTVVDTVPAGLVVDTATVSDGGVYDSVAGTITWSLTGLSATSQQGVSWSATVGDFTLRQFRNYAEIATDDGALWGGDVDSTPDDDITNDGDYDVFGVDNTSIDGAGIEADPEDDADIADAEVSLTYDLALAKSPSATTIDPNGTVTFTITVENQGDVNSGDFTVVDTLPEGTEALSASNSGDITETTVTWELTGLAPGATTSVTVTVSITDLTLRPFRNIAEITIDGADAYDAESGFKGTDVEDEDSVPDVDVDNDGDYGTFENPTNDLDDIADADSAPNGEDDADVAFFDAPVLYDLTLVKTGPAAFAGAAPATFTLEIANQGNVSSQFFRVVDVYDAGLTITAASDGGVISGQTVTWDLIGLAAGDTMTLTVTVIASDFTLRPWLSTAEITVDGADDFDTEGYENPADGDVEDDDSVPDANPANDAEVDQTALPLVQYNDPSVDEDDADIAAIDGGIDYDLALVKVLPAGQSFKKGSPVLFQIVVKNQGNVDSGPVTVQDVIPAGLLFVAASNAGLNVAQVVTWDVTNLTPGQTITLTLTVSVDNTTLASYINVAEIVSDGADAYDGKGGDVEDSDSTPDSNIANDPLVDTDDVNIDQLPGDEDDHDRAFLDPAKVRSDNPRGGTIPATGADSMRLLYGAAGLFAAGLMALAASRRRRAVA